ncbi:hypothetical protein L218DRAFT_992112 [Marasmius fiardii PR-910]|nr:hypothetical protein L218DRAFT_992112 [Marasmius fiardii PR-910]
MSSEFTFSFPPSLPPVPPISGIDQPHPSSSSSISSFKFTFSFPQPGNAPVVPIELVEHIIDFCDHKATLEACSLACRSWSHVCQSRLFRRICVRPDFWGLRGPGERETRLVALNDRLCGFIEDIDFDLRKVENHLSSAQLEFLTWVNRKLKGKTKRLRKIQIRSQTIQYGLGESANNGIQLASSISSSFSQITELNVQLDEEDLGCMIRFACSFPRLQVLSLACDGVFIYPDEASPTCTLPESLRDFRFNINWPGSQQRIYYEKWLTSHPSREILNLSLHGVSFKCLRPYTQAFSTSLKDIYLGFYYAEFHENSLCDLSAFSSLETATIGFYLRHNLPTVILRTLGSITSLRLRRINLCIHGSCLRDVTSEKKDAWTALDNLLETAQFSRVVVEIRILSWSDSSTHFSHIEEAVGSVLVKCSEQGRLAFARIVDGG